MTSKQAKGRAWWCSILTIYGWWVISFDGNTSSLWSLTLWRYESRHYGVNRSCTYEDPWGNMGAFESQDVTDYSSSVQGCHLGMEVGVWVHTSKVLPG